MPVYACRWPSGSFSLVQATNKDEASARLDEFGNPDGYPLFPISNLMLHFKLTDDGQLQLAEVGESCSESFWNKLFPELWESYDESKWEEGDNELDIRRRAVQAERKRVPVVLRNDPADIPAALKKQLLEEAKEKERNDG